ncbi:MAG: universal stress protein [Syntrophobacteraceae bacterium]
MTKRRILIVVDGSHQSIETVNYVSSVLEPEGTEIVLLHIMSSVPEEFWDLEKQPGWQQKVQVVKTWEFQMRQSIECCMEKAQQVLIEEGFSEKSVKIDIRARREGIARDITRLAHSDSYDCLIIGRRGFSTIKDLSIGSTANKIASSATDFSMMLVGGRPEPSGVIIGIDSSDGSMLAVDHVAKVFDRPGTKVLLLHVIRSTGGVGAKSSGGEDLPKRWTDLAENKIEPVMQRAADKLLSSGFSPENILTKVITGATTRAGSIMEQAKTGGYGTIVVGRRGISSVEKFSMGRVSANIVQAAKDRAVCIVG